MLRPGSTVAGACAESEARATERAREILARAGGGQLVLKSASGEIVATAAVDRHGVVTPQGGPVDEPGDDELGA